MIRSLASRLRSSRARNAALACSVVAGLLAIPACGAAVDGVTGANAKSPVALIVVQGSGQTSQAGKDLPTPLIFRAVDSAGVGMSGVTVTLSVVSGGGAVTPASDTTDAHGEFKAKWTLGPDAVAQSIIAEAPGAPAIAVAATGLLPTQIILVQGNNQTAKTNTAVTNAVIVRIVGNNNVPMQGVTVGFQVISGGGGMTPATVITNALGEASTKWTLGSIGPNVAIAAAGSLPTVSISATANP